MSLTLLAGGLGCKSEGETTGLIHDSTSGPTGPKRPAGEPALTEGTASAAVKKIFMSGLDAVRRRDFQAALELFGEARSRHNSASDDEFSHGCEFYLGRANEGLFQFEVAKVHYDRVPSRSAYRPFAASRILALTQDSDGDGYSDAWEDAEGTNPGNPLSHP